MNTERLHSIRLQPILAFDFGTKRVGVAVGNRHTRTAQALQTLSVASTAALFGSIEKLLTQWQPERLVVGIPYHPDGAAHAMTLSAKRFANRLQGRFHLPVSLVDERYSSVEASTRQANDLDAEAACVLLEQFFHEWPANDSPVSDRTST